MKVLGIILGVLAILGLAYYFLIYKKAVAGNINVEKDASCAVNSDLSNSYNNLRRELRQAEAKFDSFKTRYDELMSSPVVFPNPGFGTWSALLESAKNSRNYWETEVTRLKEMVDNSRKALDSLNC